nr:guanylate kinase [Bacteroidota bacterium]
MKLIVFCGPSGSGKTSIKNYLMQRIEVLSFSVSATTRAMRTNEHDGVDYYFLTVEEFKNKINNHEFVEWEEVYANGFYGTLKSEVERLAALNKVVIFDVDVEGGLNIKKAYGHQCLALFVCPPSIEELRKRLTKRGTETDESLQKRITKAELELTYKNKFDGVIVNENFETACDDSEKLVLQFIHN